MIETRMGYQLCSQLSTAQSGTAQWCFATGNGGQWFLKEFLSPVYPDAKLEMPAELRKRKQDVFYAFTQRRIQVYSALRNADDGNLIIPQDVFRHGNRLNIITERVNPSSLSIEQICRMPEQKRNVLLRTLVNNVRRIHRYGVVHADLKPTNIIFKETRGGYHTAKLIDFDNSFLQAAPPDDPENFMMDLVYMAPEVFRFIAGDTSVRLSNKLDVFSMGILLHEMLSGEPPRFDGKRYHYLYEAVLDGGAYSLSSRIAPDISSVLRRMLSPEPDSRPDLDEAFDVLSPHDMPKPETRQRPSGSKNTWLKPAGEL